MMTTQAQVRRAFWNYYPEWSRLFVKTKRQNAYVADVRCDFVDFVDHLARSGQINEALAARVTL